MNTRNTNSNNASAAYARVKADIEAHMARIQSALDDHLLGEAPDYSHVGDLQHLACELNDAANFITDTDEA